MVLNLVDQKPEAQERLLRDLDEFFERDRALFDLPPPRPSKTATDAS